MVSLIERDHSSAKVSRFFSNHILGTIPPSFGGWPSAKRPRDLAFALPHPAPLRRPRAVLHGSGVARRRAWCRRAGPAGRRIFSSCPCSPPFMAAMHASSAAVRARRSASGTGIPSRASTVLTGRSGPDRSRRVSGLAASCLFRARLRMRCPGFGAGCSLIPLTSWTVAPVSLWTSACLPEPTAGGEPALAFGACSRRTSGSPRLLLLSGRS